MILEIIATNLTDAIEAEKYGANRLELSPSMLELGITPSYGLIERVTEEVTIPFNVIIRPHSQSFIYNRNDLSTMKRDIRMVKQLGGDGIVIGPLTPNNVIDEEALKHLLDEAEGLDVTIHKAFDFTPNFEEALECLAKYPQISRIATSGGNQPAPEVPQKIKELIRLASNTHIEIMIAGGLDPDNFEQFCKETNPKEVHFGSGVRIDGSYSQRIDPDKVNQISSIIAGTNDSRS